SYLVILPPSHSLVIYNSMTQRSKHSAKPTKKAKAPPKPSASISFDEPPPVATISGWEDGVPFTRSVSRLDRWELQGADTLTIHIGDLDIQLTQDPHSPHLGGYVWISSFALSSFFQNLVEEQRALGSSNPSTRDLDVRL
ncbi:hypothetical protein BC936DRAFT_138897, partial [Jimgerdemannia flammicorona]